MRAPAESELQRLLSSSWAFQVQVGCGLKGWGRREAARGGLARDSGAPRRVPLRLAGTESWESGWRGQRAASLPAVLPAWRRRRPRQTMNLERAELWQVWARTPRSGLHAPGAVPSRRRPFHCSVLAALWVPSALGGPAGTTTGGGAGAHTPPP